MGDNVSMEINWPRRNRLMRLHFTCELILVLMNCLFNKTPDGKELRPEEIDTVTKKSSLHMPEDGARVDFECAMNIYQIVQNQRSNGRQFEYV